MASGAMASLGGCTFGDRIWGQSDAPRTDGHPDERDDGPSSVGTAGPGTAGTPFEFDRVVDAVADGGCDSTGGERCGGPLASVVEDGTLVTFPSGTYRFESGQRYADMGLVGFVGEGDVEFVPPAGFNGKLLEVLGDKVLFSGIDVNLLQPDTTAGLRFRAGSELLVDGVRFLGRGDHPSESVVNALTPAISDPSGQGVVRNVTAFKGSSIGHYKGGNGRVGIWVGGHHDGHLRIEDCHLEEFGNNGIYASRSSGTAEVRGGVFRNNNVSSVRLGGGGNTIRGVTIEIDLAEYSGPYTRTERDYNTRAIVLEQGTLDKSGRVLIEGCDVRLREIDRSQGAIVAWPTGNGPRIEGCRIEIENDGVPAVRGLEPVDRVADEDRAITIRATSITGGARDGTAVEFNGRPGAAIDRTTIEQPGSNRDGVRLLASTPCTLASSSITTTRFPVLATAPNGGAGQCLLTIAGNTRLTGTGPNPGTVQSSELESFDSADASTGFDWLSSNEQRCIGTDQLSELDATARARVGFVGLEAGTVQWVQHQSMET